MPSPFAAAWASAAAAISGVHGRRFRLVPMVAASDVNAAAQPDPSRAAVEFLAHLLLPAAKPLVPNAYDARTDLRPGTGSDHPMVRIQVDQAVVVRDLDLIDEVESGTRWRVAHARTTAHGTRELKVQSMGPVPA